VAVVEAFQVANASFVILRFLYALLRLLVFSCDQCCCRRRHNSSSSNSSSSNNSNTKRGNIITCESKQTEFTQSSCPDKLKSASNTLDTMKRRESELPAQHRAVF
jgi:hypothetical protein